MPASTNSIDRILESPQLPSVPAVALRLLDLTQDIDSSTKDIVDAIKSDPALAAKILRSANSSYFSFRSEIRTLEQAVPLIGRTVITSLALSFSLSAEAINGGPLGERYNQFWLRSIVQAAAAESLGSVCRIGLSTELFMTGLLIDLGQLAMLKVLRDDYLPVLEKADTEAIAIQQAEMEVLGYDHTCVADQLMRQWKLPEAMCDAARLHHGVPGDAHGTDSKELVHAMIIASLVADYFCTENPGAALASLRQYTRDQYGLSEDQLTEFLEKVATRMDETAELLSANTDDIPSPADLMALACEQLAQISIAQDRQHREETTQRKLTELEKRELQTQNDKLREQVFRDPLTRLYNRRFFDETMQNELRRACRRGASLGVIFVDADHFKRLNDSYGHAFGDEVLARIAEVIQDSARNSDIAARYGGEEFVVLAIDASETGLKILAERIRHAVESETIKHGEDRVSVTVSVGGAFTVPHRDEEDPGKQLLEAADAAMYESKRRGRNCITVHSMASDRDRRISQLVMECRFSHWLVENGIVKAPAMFDVAQSSRPSSIHVGELAHQKEWMEMADVQRVLEIQEVTGERFGAIANRLNMLTDTQLAVLLAEQSESTDTLIEQLCERDLLSMQEAEVLRARFEQDRSDFVQHAKPVAGAPADSKAQCGIQCR